MASGPVNRTLADTKRRLFGDLPDLLIELGPGIGANFEYYRPGTAVIGFEPNPSMHPALSAAADEHDIRLDLSVTDLRHAEFEDGSHDAVVSTLVLCSVSEPTALVDEIHRILRPGGRFYFLEHIAPRPGSAASVIARVVRRPWAAFGDNCNVLAETADVIRNAGFGSIDATVDAFGGRLDPSSDHYWGVAVK